MNYRGDYINKLPTDNHLPTHDEISIVNSLFKKDQTKIIKIISELKLSILVSILFIIFSLPIVDQLIKKFIPVTTNNNIFLLVVKGFLFAIVFYILSNLNTLKKQ